MRGCVSTLRSGNLRGSAIVGGNPRCRNPRLSRAELACAAETRQYARTGKPRSRTKRVTGGVAWKEKKGRGTPLFPATLQRERASVHEHCRQMWPYLVDPASSHMLVSKIKPCMSKYILLHSETANGSLNQLWFIRWYNPTWITVVILELIHATKLRPHGKSAFIRSKPIGRKAVLFGDSG